MSPETTTVAAPNTPESAKRRQIIEGARRIFLSQGFDAASMGEIAREAGVSKGTLYVYFDSKEALFAALIAESKRATAERNLAALDPEDPDVAHALTVFATGLIEKVTQPEHMALLRMVIAAAEKFPSVAAAFYEAGPAHGARSLTAYIEEQNRRGRLAVPDPATTAWQFLGMCTHSMAVAILAGAASAPDAARVAALADNAVGMFMAAYTPRD